MQQTRHKSVMRVARTMLKMSKEKAHSCGRRAKPCITVSQAMLSAVAAGCPASGRSASGGVKRFATC
jgi:hypothetical protein